MHAHVSFLTLAVSSLADVRQFYVGGLGWEPVFEGEEVLMIRVGETLMLSFWSEVGFEAEVGPLRRGEGSAPLTLSYNVASPAAVDGVLAEVRAAGASSVRAGVTRVWGGYSGYFTDPAGFSWEVAYNPDPTMTFVNAPAS